ncbi:hypothetical protein [Mesorhizobium sp. M0578]|uniref:hypothetical protein n=1 Tax=unclassified Mesorhizobium TaxID=325217 RepID=UPI0033392DD4
MDKYIHRQRHFGHRETITIPPNGQKVVICDLWPDCGCLASCTDSGDTSPVARWVLAGLMVAVALIIVGLFYVGLR